MIYSLAHTATTHFIHVFATPDRDGTGKQQKKIITKNVSLIATLFVADRCRHNVCCCDLCLFFLLFIQFFASLF